MTSWHGQLSALLTLCVGNLPMTYMVSLLLVVVWDALRSKRQFNAVYIQYIPRNMHTVLIHIQQGCFAGAGAIVRLPQCQWSKPDGYGKISQCITTTKHNKAKTVCIFLGIYCIYEARTLSPVYQQLAWHLTVLGHQQAHWWLQIQIYFFEISMHIKSVIYQKWNQPSHSMALNMISNSSVGCFRYAETV